MSDDIPMDDLMQSFLANESSLDLEDYLKRGRRFKEKEIGFLKGRWVELHREMFDFNNTNEEERHDVDAEIKHRGEEPPFEMVMKEFDAFAEKLRRWAEDGGRGAFEHAMALIDEAEGHNCGRLTGMITPTTVDTCTADLLRDSLAEAEARDRPFQLHAGEAVMEFLEITRRHGKTPIQWLAELGILGPRTTIGHGIFLDHHSWLHWATRDDLRLLAESGTSVAHCPTVFSRYGITLENLGAYLDAGINMGIGTDTHPHNMIEEMRAAAVMARVSAENMFSLKTADVFYAATIGGSRVLGRDDLGRLAVGAKADVVLIDLAEPSMQPVYDPLRCLIYPAADRAVRDVYVGGVKVVADHRVLTLDFDEAADRVSAIQRDILAKVPARDHANRTAQDIAPLTLPIHNGG